MLSSCSTTGLDEVKAVSGQDSHIVTPITHDGSQKTAEIEAGVRVPPDERPNEKPVYPEVTLDEIATHEAFVRQDALDAIKEKTKD